MKSEIEKFELINRHVNQELSSVEENYVLEKIKSDPEFAQEVELARITNKLVIGANLDQLRNKIKNDLINIENKKKSLNIKYSILIIGLTLFSTTLFFVKDKFLPDNIFIIKNKKSIKDSISNFEREKTFKDSSIQLKYPEEKNTVKNNYLPKNLPDSPNIDTIKSISEEIPLNSIKEINNRSNSKPEVKEKLVEIPVIPCQTFNNNTLGEIIPVCFNKKMARIIIDEDIIHSGTPPYQYSMDGGPYDEKNDFIVSFGIHLLKLKDEKGCILSKEIQISNSICSKNNSFSFNPDYQEVVEIPYDSEDGIISIISQEGTIILKDKISNVRSWNGYNNKGNIVTSGLYIYIIEYSNGIQETGEISVIH